MMTYSPELKKEITGQIRAEILHFYELGYQHYGASLVGAIEALNFEQMADEAASGVETKTEAFLVACNFFRRLVKDLDDQEPAQEFIELLIRRGHEQAKVENKKD